MPSSRILIPRPDAEFDLWLTNLVNYVIARTSGVSPVWDHIPQSRVDGH
ncbi:MAG: hypothetical protein LBG25_06225 [Spirochaetaceae bacterium]|jgi:hypothetical protein|nr:hypothetical protein [Spirochaetaceae bacterium]